MCDSSFAGLQVLVHCSATTGTTNTVVFSSGKTSHVLDNVQVSLLHIFLKQEGWGMIMHMHGGIWTAQSLPQTNSMQGSV